MVITKASANNDDGKDRQDLGIEFIEIFEANARDADR